MTGTSSPAEEALLLMLRRGNCTYTGMKLLSLDRDLATQSDKADPPEAEGQGPGAWQKKLLLLSKSAS